MRPMILRWVVVSVLVGVCLAVPRDSFGCVGDCNRNAQVTIDELAELVDINLNDFEHSITFGNRPLFTPPVYVDTAALRAIGTLQPWFRQLQDIRFGFLTTLSLAGAELSCDIDITPALTPVTAVLGFFCPPCVLSLFMTGSASASVENATFPIFLYLEQDPLRLDPPRWRTVFDNAEVLEFPDAGHAPPEERAPELLPTLRQFLAR